MDIQPIMKACGSYRFFLHKY